MGSLVGYAAGFALGSVATGSTCGLWDGLEAVVGSVVGEAS